MAQTWLQKYSTYEEEVTGYATGITAYAGGGQASATALTAKYNNVTVVATNNDSVKLPSALTGKRVLVRNSDAAQTLDVYPQTGEYIDGNAVNTSVNIGFNTGAVFECIVPGYWQSISYP